ncbi:DUF4112 domain-containing protein [Hyphococcus sp.]|uniref:DUF4112 domain-containing protein n=1 Tax=Hyphococcus sp. TaxID=2038636 RepID=UPI003CCBAEFC
MTNYRTIDPDTGVRAPYAPDSAAAHAAARARVNKLADFLDTKYRLPIIGYRFGWDSILGLIPGVGDTASAAISMYIIWEARRAGAGLGLIVRMIYNVLIDTILGAVPLFGDIFDFAFKANLRNAQLLQEHYDEIEARRLREAG